MLTLEDKPEQLPGDIYKNGIDEERRISGIIKMAWPLSKKFEVIVMIQSSPPTNNPHQFRVDFQLDEEHIRLLNLAPNDEFVLSLRGATVDLLPTIPKLSTLPMRIVFSKGVYIEWKHAGEWKILNTWPQISDNIESNWFLSQEVKAECSDPRGVKRNHGNDLEVKNDHMPQETFPKEPKKRQRMDAKARKRQVQQQQEKLSRNADVMLLDNGIVNKYLPISNTRLTVSLNNPDIPSANPPPADQISLQETPVTTEGPPPNSVSGHAMGFKAGFQAGSVIYPALSDVQERQMVSLIGVVVGQTDIKKTSKGDWNRNVNLVDMSNCASSGIKINCFAKHHEQWLPQSRPGDVLILKNVKIQAYQGHLSGVCYHNRLCWAAFSPSKGEFHHGPSNEAPKAEGLADGGFGVLWSPFYQPGPAETTYCIELSDWWRKVKTKDSSAITEVSSVNAIPNHYRPQRVHRLLSEAGPSVPPDGFFNCTVEILKVYDTNNMTYTVYVTDYTRNEGVMVVQSAWCHPLLSEFVVQFEFWDEAAEVASQMQPGQYYIINNARMKDSTSGYLEGKVVQNKMVQLFEDDSGNVRLQALLERKKIFQAKKQASETRSNYQLIQDIEENMFFHCTVEVLRSESSPNGRACLYVTDYTSHPSLLNTIDDPAFRALNGRVVKILLIQEQRETANIVEPESFYCIRNLRLKNSPIEGFCGTLGGPEKLVVKLNPNKLDNEHLNGLKRRREEWQRKVHQKAQRQQFLRIRDVVSNKSFGHHLICARPIDFYPLDMKDAFYQRCTQCDIEIPKTVKACLRCGDFEHEHVQYFYQLYILVEDEDGEQLKISVDDKCPLISGIARVCIQENCSVFEQLRQRLQPILGNLMMVHSDLKAGERIKVETLEFYFQIESWSIPGGKTAFRLLEYKSI